MPKMTLLELTQNILNAMESDEVNSISDTVESLAVAEVVRETYFDLFGNLDIPEQRALLRLEALSDVTKPTVLKVPDSIKKIYWVKYNNTDVEYLEPNVFFEYTQAKAGQDNVDQFANNDGVLFYIGTNADPQYYTSFDDVYLTFDSYDNSSDSTLQESKSLVWCQRDPEFELADDYVPRIDANMFPQLLAEAKNTCFVNFKQTPNQNEARKAFRNRVRSQQDMFKAGGKRPIDRLPDYGRRR